MTKLTKKEMEILGEVTITRIKNLLNCNYSIDEISEHLNVSKTIIEKIINTKVEESK